ncbi:unnamed protein product [Polarella glacialis]|uniref:Poly [ADP-ribose] polymerase n=1 Tax=Polarella glacialis TaxID=89957 RepID=A0A813FB24_POLGL|nr:unnamed protein product [Polarella glacialis]
MRGMVLVAVSLVILAAAEHAEPEVSMVSLSSDDACQSMEPDGSCALNALQQRAKKTTTASASEPEAASTGEPTDEILLALGADPLKHYAQDCHTACKGGGWCPDFCGQGNACCGYKDPNSPPECKSVDFWPVLWGHTCVFPNAVPPASQDCVGRGDGKTMKLYHQTSAEIGALILANGFRAGFRGWCGGAIYFASTPESTFSKTSALESHKGFMIEANVSVGRVKTMKSTCDMSMTGSKLHEMGYDTITFNPVDGDEYVIYCSSQVISTKAVPLHR